jgi:putative glutamine amidotransferase
MPKRHPIIGITTYEKRVGFDPDIDMVGVATEYKNAVLRAGGIPILLPLGLPPAAVRTVMQQVDGLILPGGGDIEPSLYNGHVRHPRIRGVDPRRDEMELIAVREAVDLDIPLLAICRGHQLLNVALGGELWQDVATQMPEPVEHDFYREGVARNYRPHTVAIRPNSSLATLLGKTHTLVNSIHHQGVKRLGDGLIASATAPDGLIEATELPDKRFVVSVQWHPENLIEVDPQMLGLFHGLVKAACDDCEPSPNGSALEFAVKPAYDL